MNFYWLWVSGIAFLACIVLHGFKKDRWSYFIMGCSLFGFGMFFIPPLIKDAKQTRQYESTCLKAGNTTIVTEEKDGWKRMRCVKPDYKIEVPPYENYCTSHGGNYMWTGNGYLCVKKDALVDIKVD